MKILAIVILIFFSSFTVAQTIGDLDTPYATNGWDLPAEYTMHYSLPVYTLLSNPGGWINLSQVKIDSLLNELVVYTDTTQLQIRNDTLIHSNYLSGQSTFTLVEQYDTVLVTGLDSADIIVVSVRESIPGANDHLGVIVTSGQFIASRAAAGTSALKWNWIWIRKY